MAASLSLAVTNGEPVDNEKLRTLRRLAILNRKKLAYYKLRRV